MAEPADLDIHWTRARAASHLRELLICGVLVFPEGTRSRDGRVGRLRPGAALLAAEHHLPSEVMERVRLFLAECRAETEREPHAEHADRSQPA